MGKKLILLILPLTILLLVACSNEASKSVNKEQGNKGMDNLNESGMPIVKEPITLHFMARKSDADDNSEVMIWKKYKEMTGINIDWEMMARSGISEKRNLALASGNLPDVFYTAHMPTSDLLKYGEQGVFIGLTDLIEEHMPNLSKLFEEYPEIKKGLTFPDGNIYSLPTIYSPDFKSVLVHHKLWIKEDWLVKLNMDMPETTDEFYNYLKAVKQSDLNGNGKADEIPYGATSISGLTAWLKGSFGIGNRGRNHPYADVDPETNEIRFFSIGDRYKEMLQYLNKLYSEGLIQENIYSIEENQVFATGAEGLYGSTVTTSTETLWGEEGKKYIGMAPLEGPHGDHIYTNMRSPLGSMGGFVVTNENKYPAATLRWMDYFYSDEGTKLFFMGIEGETYEVTDEGKYEYVDKIKNSPDGLTLEQELGKYFTWLGGGYPGIVKQEFFNGAETLPSSLEATEKIEPYVIDEIWPSFTYTTEENREMTTLSADIEKYVVEMQDKFITGNVPFSEWDKYVNTIKDMGLEDYMKIQEAAYERFDEN